MTDFQEPGDAFAAKLCQLEPIAVDTDPAEIIFAAGYAKAIQQRSATQYRFTLPAALAAGLLMAISGYQLGHRSAINSLNHVTSVEQESDEAIPATSPQLNPLSPQLAIESHTQRDSGIANTNEVDSSPRLKVVPVSNDASPDARLRVRTQGFNLDSFASASTKQEDSRWRHTSPAQDESQLTPRSTIRGIWN